MSKKIAVMTDANACLDYFEYSYDIPILRSMIHLKDEEFLDHVELTAEEFYKRIKSDPSLFPRTSQPPTEIMRETYKDLKEKGYTDVIFVTISSHMSGINGAAHIAAKDVPGINVHVFDSKSVAFPQAKMVLTAAEMIENHQPIEKILKTLEHIREHNHIYFAVETLVYLIKNGRLSHAKGFMANMLKIKPLLHISKEGKVENVEKIRTFKKAVSRVIEMFLEETEGKNIEVFICHAHNEEIKSFILEELKAARPNMKEPLTMPLTPAVGAHAGPGAIGLGYYIKP